MQIDWKWNRNCVEFLILLCSVITITNVECQNFPFRSGPRRQYSNFRDSITFPESAPPRGYFDEPAAGREYDDSSQRDYGKVNEV